MDLGNTPLGSKFRSRAVLGFEKILGTRTVGETITSISIVPILGKKSRKENVKSLGKGKSIKG